MTRGLLQPSYEWRCGCAVALAMVAAIFAAIALYAVKVSREKIATAGKAQAEISAITPSGYAYKFTIGNTVYTGYWEEEPEPGHHVGDLIPVSYKRSDPWVNNYGTIFRVSMFDLPALWWILSGLALMFALSNVRRNPRSYAG